MLRAGVVTAVLLLSASPAAAGINLQEGEWEIRSRTEVDGVPMGMSAVFSRQCLSADKPVPDQSSQWLQCSLIEMKQQGDTVTWTVECTGKMGTTKNSGSITYRGNSFGGTVTSDVSGLTGMADGSEAALTIRMNGWRVGPCPHQ